MTEAVTVTLYEYVQQQTGRTRWQDAGWNGEHGDVDDGKGWAKTGNTRQDVVTPAVTEDHWVVDQAAAPAVDEVSHLELTWAPTSPGGDWSGPLDTRLVGGSTETNTISGDDVPSGDGWTKVGTHDFAAVIDTVWALAAPSGYDPTGDSRVHDVTAERADESSPTAPAGDGWTEVADSRIVVVDQPESTELVGDGWTEQVLLTPEAPATEACATVSPAGGAAATPHGSGSAVAAPASAGTVLPATGNPVSPLLVTAGLGALLAGGVLVRVSRRRQTT